MEEKVIVAATGNEHKLKEIREILKGYTVISAKEAGFFEEVDETGSTFLENAFLKARAVVQKTGRPALADDSGLNVDALGGAPGIYSARYSGGGSAENRKLLLKNMKGVTDRAASFTCAVALVFPDGREYSAIGKTYGTILSEERGENGFGYDSLFMSSDLHKSFAEASDEEKNSVSHRGRALQKLFDSLKGVL
ncbi:MAG: RdgB/HAM1 family non-canonical purine NTP pyrophosphatase [Clostridia bacterium]|nr:RdgB/HAM1 family non-canonical purine NTP pyrophosphatase [Clostridia bacterium]